MRSSIPKICVRQRFIQAGRSRSRPHERLRLAFPACSTLAALVALCIASAPAQAESLTEALSGTYGYNPRLDAERAFSRGTDEEVARAMSGYRPTVTGEADVSWERDDSRPSTIFDGVTKPRERTRQRPADLSRSDDPDVLDAFRFVRG